jgi:hypothetical protein
MKLRGKCLTGIPRSRWKQHARRDVSQKEGRTWEGTEKDEPCEDRNESKSSLLDNSQTWKCRKKKGNWRKKRFLF